MKKIFAIFLTFLILLIQSPVFALSELYYVHNAKKINTETIVKRVAADKKYEIINGKNPIIATKDKTENNYSAIYLLENGNDIYYYFESNDSTKSKLNEAIKKEFKKAGYTTESSNNKALLDSFSMIVTRALTGGDNENKYKFQEEIPFNYDEPAEEVQPKKDNSVLQGYVAKIQKGTKFTVFLQNSINTASAQAGDEVVALFNADWHYNNITVIPQGSFMKGNVTKAHPALYASRNGKVEFEFKEIYTPYGEIIPISTESVVFNVTDDGRVVRFIGSTLANAAIGALMGLAFGALGGDASSALKGLAIGAGAGAAGTILTGAAAKGIDAEIPALTEIEVKLSKTLSLAISN